MTETCRSGDAFRLGRLNVHVEGHDLVGAEVVRELSEGCLPALGPAAIRFQFRDVVRARDDDLRSGSLSAGGQSWCAEYGRLAFRATIRGEALEVDVAPTRLGLVHRRPLDKLSRWGERSHLDTTHLLAKDFLYSVFDGITQLRHVPLGQSWVHAAAATRGDRTVLLTGSGGAGKTSSALKLVLRSGWRYLSDDLALVDSDGVVHRSPKRLQVYSYNVENDRGLRRSILSDMSRSARAAFAVRERVLGRRQARHRIAATRLFGEHAVANEAPISHVIHLRSSHRSAPVVKERSATWLAERSAAVLVEELQPLSSQLWTARGLDDALALPDPVELHDATVTVLERAFARTSGWTLDVPTKTPPDAIASEVERLLERG